MHLMTAAVGDSKKAHKFVGEECCLGRLVESLYNSCGSQRTIQSLYLHSGERGVSNTQVESLYLGLWALYHCVGQHIRSSRYAAPLSLRRAKLAGLEVQVRDLRHKFWKFTALLYLIYDFNI